ncbi:hypothetical protein CTI12_AA459660 [Artemisia annua]|uniref:Uncharacterized protein n=1 Tax=Artemisia annua TaxID=35608 RepID=A0A2U1LQM1_ARTAN|nr:hypothetical protein CTI12_AA459660 [Artemisia annua]
MAYIRRGLSILGFVLDPIPVCIRSVQRVVHCDRLMLLAAGTDLIWLVVFLVGDVCLDTMRFGTHDEPPFEGFMMARSCYYGCGAAINQLQENRTQYSQPQTIHEHQLKAFRDVAIATAAKAKLLLREIKTVKADLAFAKQRSSQLEEEYKFFERLIRLQLETLLAEKARLANENSVYVRENGCLREIIKYHKLSMQDIVYVDEGIEEVAEVNPKISRTLSVSPPLPSSPQTKTPLRKKESPPIPKSLDVPTKKNPPIKSSTNHAST